MAALVALSAITKKSMSIRTFIFSYTQFRRARARKVESREQTHEVKAEAGHLSWSEDGKKLKRLRRHEASSSKGEIDASGNACQLERELNDEINDLITKERQSNDELQGARRVLMKGLNKILGGKHVSIGIKNIGEINSKVIVGEMVKRFSPEIAATKCVELCSLWHPYQIAEDDNGKPKVVLNALI